MYYNRPLQLDLVKDWTAETHGPACSQAAISPIRGQCY